VRSLLARLAAPAAVALLSACGGSSPAEDAASDAVLASIVVPGLASIAVASDRQGAIWLVWTERQVGLSGSVGALRIRPDGRQDRWTLARGDGWFGVLTLNFIDDRPLVGWYQVLAGGGDGVRVMAWEAAGWRDEVSVIGAGATSDYQLRTAADGVAWLLVRDLLPQDGGSRCTVQRRLSPGTWSSPLDVDSTGSRTASHCVMAPGRGGELMAAWSVQAIASTAPPSAVRSAHLAAGAQAFEAPSTAVSVASYVDRLESVGAGRWALLWYTVTATNDVGHNIQLFRRGQWSGTAHPVGVPGESNYSVRATSNGAFVDVVWTGIRITDLPGGSAPRAARFDADTDTLGPTQSLGRFNPGSLLAWSAGVAPDGRVAAGFATVTGPGEAWLALGDEDGAWRPAFRIGHPSRSAFAPTALPMPDGSWAAVWHEFSAQTGTLDLLLRRVR
jgi:hypothetical protein